MSSGMAEPEAAEQISAIERAQELASLTAARGARWNGVYLALTGIFLGAFAGSLGHAYAPALVMVAALCFIVAAVAVARLIWRRRQAAAALDDVKVAPPDRATRGVVGAPD